MAQLKVVVCPVIHCARRSFLSLQGECLIFQRSTHSLQMLRVPKSSMSTTVFCHRAAWGGLLFGRDSANLCLVSSTNGIKVISKIVDRGYYISSCYLPAVFTKLSAVTCFWFSLSVIQWAILIQVIFTWQVNPFWHHGEKVQQSNSSDHRLTEVLRGLWYFPQWDLCCCSHVQGFLWHLFSDQRSKMIFPWLTGEVFCFGLFWKVLVGLILVWLV